MPPQNSEETQWFIAHLQPHERLLRGWLQRQFPLQRDIDDIIQEAFVRVLRAREGTVIESPKAFLFATARNLALLEMRRRTVSGEDSLAETDVLAVLDKGEDAHQAAAHAQELELLTKAIQSLPARCRQVITLRKIYGLSQKEVAAKLGIAEHTVEAQGTIGLRKIAKFIERFEHHGLP